MAHTPLMQGTKLDDPRLKHPTLSPVQTIIRWNIDHGFSVAGRSLALES